jgi:DNA-binding HxlR family transcriptional regulator
VRSYRQYCALAKALDVIGDRWSLLIVRELLLRGSLRYTDLQAGLPGIATNLLANRLRELGEAEVVRREAAPPPIATDLFRLTPRGEELGPAVLALGRWGEPLIADREENDEFRAHWLSLQAKLHLADPAPGDPPVTIELRAGEEPLTIETVDGALRTRPGPAKEPDLVLTGSPELLVGVLTGSLSVADARAHGLQHEGALRTLRRVQQRAVGA